jgi:hypothetical protein
VASVVNYEWADGQFVHEPWMSEPILCCGAQDDVRLGDQENATVSALVANFFCYWNCYWQAIVDAAATLEGVTEMLTR